MVKLKAKKKTRICPRCRGNGYFTVKESVGNQVDKVVQCPMCNSQGELDDESDDILITADGIVALQ